MSDRRMYLRGSELRAELGLFCSIYGDKFADEK